MRKHLAIICFVLLAWLMPATVSAQMRVKGNVSAASDGEPLIGVGVMAVGSKEAVITDLDGNYTIDLPKGVAFLMFNYMGMNSERKSVQGLPKNADGSYRLDVLLTEDKNVLEEVVVTGITSTDKRLFTIRAHRQ